MISGDEIWTLISKIRPGIDKKEGTQNQTDQRTFLVVGLGNPGREYKKTRHNAGFLVIDELCQYFDTALDRVQSKALITIVKECGHRIILAKPQTFMNLSGQSVSGLIRFYKIDKQDILIIHDDIDLALGAIRIRPSGGAGGQKGLASIIQQLGTQTFPRLRIGINRPPGRMKAADYVLQNFSTSDLEILPQVVKKAADAARAFVCEGLEQSMNKYNGQI